MGLKLYIIPDNFRNHFINENFSYQISMKLIDFKIIVWIKNITIKASL